MDLKPLKKHTDTDMVLQWIPVCIGAYYWLIYRYGKVCKCFHCCPILPLAPTLATLGLRTELLHDHCSAINLQLKTFFCDSWFGSLSAYTIRDCVKLTH